MVRYPSDWEVKKLEECCVVLDNKRKPVSGSARVAGKYPYYGANGILDYVSNYIFDGAYVLVGEDGSVITPNGNPVVIWAEGKIWVNNHAHVIKEKEDTSLRYLFYYLQTINISELIHGNIPKLTGHDLRNLLILLPPLKEQIAIAETLAAFDTHITNLTELITKKKAIRDGALDDLMSGRTRLEGFCGDWEMKNFDEMFYIFHNNTLSRDKLTTRGKIGDIHYGDVLIKYGIILTTNDDIPKIKLEYESSAKIFLRKNDIIIADTAEDETVGKAVQIGDIDIPLVAGLHTIPCRPIAPTAPGYLGYYINCNAYHNQLLPYITGIKVSSISKASIRKTLISLPPLDEQKAIADTLSALDKEISSLENERDKIFQIRDGAINDLLTGKVRLKIGI